MLVSYRQLAATTAVTARVVESELVESRVFSWSRSHFVKIAEVGVRFSKMLESEIGFKKVGSRFFELEQFMGWSRSRNPKKSSDSTTLLEKTSVP